MKIKILPKLPSALIRIALNDLNKTEKSNKYKINMREFHRPGHNARGREICAVCLAGAVMVQTLKVRFNTYSSPSAFSNNEDQLWALNCLRVGDVRAALFTLGIQRKGAYMLNVTITRYKTNKTQFKRDMRTLARNLEKHNL